MLILLKGLKYYIVFCAEGFENIQLRRILYIRENKKDYHMK